MRAKISFAVIVFLLIISLFFVNFNFFVKADSKEIYVRSNYFGTSEGSAEKPYKSIQEAIDIANVGDTIYIFGGLYKENLIVNKKLKIVGGIDNIETILDSRFDERYLIDVTAHEVTIEGLTACDADGITSSPIGALISLKSNNNRIISNNITSSKSYGIYIHSSSNDNFISNNFVNNTKRGIYIYLSSTNDIINNEIMNCFDSGIYIESALGNNRLYGNLINRCGTGIYAQSGTAINITKNIISNNTINGITLNNLAGSIIKDNYFFKNSGSSLYLRSSSCTVSNNTFEYNQRGIFLESDNNIITKNKIYHSSASGIYAQMSSNNNKIYLNDFKANSVSAQDFGTNVWYIEYQGNYWDDYGFSDKDRDGIGDESYSKNGVNDIFPLGYFLKPPNKPTDPSPKQGETGVGLQVTLQVKVEDPDSDELTVYFYKEDGTLISGLSKNPVTKVRNNSVATFRFYLEFNTTFAWYAVASDGVLENQSDPFIFYTAVTPPENIPPVAVAGGPYFGGTDQLIQFDSTGSKDDDGKIDFYRWNFGDGSSEIIKENPTHYYSNEGEYTVTLTVIDNNGSSTSDTATVTISYRENNPPVVNALIPTSGNTGKIVAFNSIGTVDPDGDTLSYLWNFGDGTTSTENNPTHIYQSAGKYLVTLTVSDLKYSEQKSGYITITKASEESPGFELLLFMIGLFSILYFKKLSRKGKAD